MYAALGLLLGLGMHLHLPYDFSPGQSFMFTKPPEPVSWEQTESPQPAPDGTPKVGRWFKVVNDTGVAIASVSVSDEEDEHEPALVGDGDIAPGKFDWAKVDDAEQPGACLFTLRIEFVDGRTGANKVNVCYVHVSLAHEYLYRLPFAAQ